MIHLSDTVTLILFAVTLILCIAVGLPILIALFIGYIIFFCYSLGRGYSPAAILKMSVRGVCTAKNILITFVLIGMLTALWRAAGTIPAIVCYSAGLMNPSVMILMAFLLNALVAVLTGTSFGTAATMGVICMTMAKAMGCNPVLTGGAILSGAYFGDRCSPVSTSALLVSELTKTSIFDNIRGMIRTAAVPTLLTCLFYGACGILFPAGGGTAVDVTERFGTVFSLGILPVLPAALILILSGFRVGVKQSMLASILLSFFICIFWQGLSVPEILKFMLIGYHCPDASLSSMIDGGGISSMVRVGAIICISSSYSGIFDETGILRGLKDLIFAASKRISVFGTILGTSAIASMVACNQTLATILVNQLCRDLKANSKEFAIDLENSVIVLAALVPWSIAGTVPLTSVGAPLSGMAAAVFLYLLPLWHLLRSKD